MALVLGEVMVFARHTVTQVLMALGLTERTRAWYRLFGAGRFNAEQASAVWVVESLPYVGADELYVVAGV